MQRTLVLKPYLMIVAVLATIGFLDFNFGEDLIHFSEHGTLHGLPVIIAIAVVGAAVWLGGLLAKGTAVPPSALYLVLGIAVSTITDPVNVIAAGSLHVLASAVLMKGGAEINLKEFGRIAVQVLLLSFVSLLITAFLFSAWLLWFGIPATGANLTGAIIASTDPAAILPVLGSLTWATERARRARDIAVSESAGTDVAGALLVAAFIPKALSGTMIGLANGGYESLFSSESGWFLLEQIGGGCVGGGVGYIILSNFQRRRKKQEAMRTIVEESDMDKLWNSVKDVGAFVIALIGCLVVASWTNGNSFLAAFLSGLFLDVETHFKKAQHVYDENIDVWVIPLIFVLGGTMVGILDLVDYAWVGTLSSAILIGPIRYFAVFLVLGCFMLIKVRGEPMSSPKEAKFVASVRQVGAIGIALAAGTAAAKIAGTEGVMPITVWVSFWTLLYCTPRNKQVAIKSGLATET